MAHIGLLPSSSPPLCQVQAWYTLTSRAPRRTKAGASYQAFSELVGEFQASRGPRLDTLDRRGHKRADIYLTRAYNRLLVTHFVQ